MFEKFTTDSSKIKIVTFYFLIFAENIFPEIFHTLNIENTISLGFLISRISSKFSIFCLLANLSLQYRIYHRLKFLEFFLIFPAISLKGFKKFSLIFSKFTIFFASSPQYRTNARLNFFFGFFPFFQRCPGGLKIFLFLPPKYRNTPQLNFLKFSPIFPGMLDYLCAYADSFQMSQFLRLRHCVTDVRRAPSYAEDGKWTVRHKNW